MPRRRRVTRPAAVGLVILISALAPGASAHAADDPSVATSVLARATFDDGFAGWRGFRARLSLVPRATGGRAARVALRASARRARTFSIHRRIVAASVADATYSASGLVRGPRGSLICLRLRELAGLRAEGGASQCVRSTGGWQRLATEYRARQAGNAIRVAVARQRSRRANRFLVDDLQVSASTQTDSSSDSSSSPPGRRGPMPVVGTQFHGMWDYQSDAQRAAVLDKLAAAGITWIRLDLSWCSFQEQDGNTVSAWYASRADWIVDQARARGLRILATLYCTPGWANGREGEGWEAASPVPPSDPDDFGRMAQWAASHFRGRIDAWEVWNEPNLSQFFTGDAETYVRLLQAGYPAFKAGDPEALVVLGGPSYADAAWVEAAYEAGAQGFFDVMAVHPYVSPADLPPESDNGTIWTVAAVRAIRALMESHGDGGKPMWFTEMGWSAHPNSGSEPGWKRGVSAETQAAYVVRALEYIRTLPYVTQVFWYNERDRASGDAHEDNYGLLERDLSEKPAYVALKRTLSGS